MGHSELYEIRRTLNARIRLNAFFFNHESEIVSADRRRAVSLVNVNHEGARLRMRQGVDYGLNAGSDVTLNLNLGDSCTENLVGRVSHTDGDDLYVDFGSRLTVGASLLQSLGDN